MAPLVIMSLWIGIYPQPFLNYVARPVNAVVRQVRPTYPIPACLRLFRLRNVQRPSSKVMSDE